MHIQNPGIFKTLVYSRSWHIHNPGIFGITEAEPEAYQEACQTSTIEHFTKIVNCYNYFRKSYLFPQNIIKTILIFTPEVFIIYKNVWRPRGRGL